MNNEPGGQIVTASQHANQNAPVVSVEKGKIQVAGINLEAFESDAILSQAMNIQQEENRMKANLAKIQADKEVCLALIDVMRWAIPLAAIALSISWMIIGISDNQAQQYGNNLEQHGLKYSNV